MEDLVAVARPGDRARGQVGSAGADPLVDGLRPQGRVVGVGGDALTRAAVEDEVHGLAGADRLDVEHRRLLVVGLLAPPVGVLVERVRLLHAGVDQVHPDRVAPVGVRDERVAEHDDPALAAAVLRGVGDRGRRVDGVDDRRGPFGRGDLGARPARGLRGRRLEAGRVDGEVDVAAGEVLAERDLVAVRAAGHLDVAAGQLGHRQGLERQQGGADGGGVGAVRDRLGGDDLIPEARGRRCLARVVEHRVERRVLHRQRERPAPGTGQGEHVVLVDGPGQLALVAERPRLEVGLLAQAAGEAVVLGEPVPVRGGVLVVGPAVAPVVLGEDDRPVGQRDGPARSVILDGEQPVAQRLGAVVEPERHVGQPGHRELRRLAGAVHDALGLVHEQQRQVSVVVPGLGATGVREHGGAGAVPLAGPVLGEQVASGRRLVPAVPGGEDHETAVQAVAGGIGAGLGHAEVGARAVVVDGELAGPLGEPGVGALAAAGNGGVVVVADVGAVAGARTGDLLGHPVDVHADPTAGDAVAEPDDDAVADRGPQHQGRGEPGFGLDLRGVRLRVAVGERVHQPVGDVVAPAVHGQVDLHRDHVVGHRPHGLGADTSAGGRGRRGRRGDGGKRDPGSHDESGEHGARSESPCCAQPGRDGGDTDPVEEGSHRQADTEGQQGVLRDRAEQAAAVVRRRGEEQPSQRGTEADDCGDRDRQRGRRHGAQHRHGPEGCRHHQRRIAERGQQQRQPGVVVRRPGEARQRMQPEHADEAQGRCDPRSVPRHVAVHVPHPHMRPGAIPITWSRRRPGSPGDLAETLGRPPKVCPRDRPHGGPLVPVASPDRHAAAGPQLGATT